MGNGNVSGALAGITLGLVAPARAYLDDLESDVDRADRRARRAQINNEVIALRLRRLLASGGIQRLGSARVNDLIAGLAYGAPIDEQPAVGGAPISALGRLNFGPDYLSEDETEWPGESNAYDDNGLLLHPSQVFQKSSLSRVGAMLAYREVEALIAGVCQAAQPTGAEATQMYRLWRSLAYRAGQIGLTQIQYDAIAAAIWPGTGTATGAPGGLLDIIQANSASVGATGAEEAIGGGLLIPANRFPVGRTVHYQQGFRLAAVAAGTVRYGLRLGTAAGLAGTLIAQNTAALIDPADAGDNVVMESWITRRPDDATGPIFVAYTVITARGGAISIVEVQRFAPAVIAALIPAAGQVSPAMVLQPSVLYSAANAANLTFTEQGQTFLM